MLLVPSLGLSLFSRGAVYLDEWLDSSLLVSKGGKEEKRSIEKRVHTLPLVPLVDELQHLQPTRGPA